MDGQPPWDGIDAVFIPVSVPTDPDEREEALRQADLFMTPGETRAIPHEHSEPADRQE
jgi:hypothetical protein